MNVLLLRVLFFCLTPLGIFILIKGITLIRKAFNGKILLEVPYLENGGEFSITEAGNFSVWQKGELFKRTPVDKFKVRIFKAVTNEEIKLNTSLLSPRTNDFSTGRMELYRFFAPAGNYKIIFQQGSNVSGLESIIGSVLPIQPVNLSKYFIQIREAQPQINSLIAIPMILFGILGTVGGIILGVLAEQVVK